jgi:hypothetical protein
MPDYMPDYTGMTTRKSLAMRLSEKFRDPDFTAPK